jgi:glycosyltransferase involved in cell wall biosynthesis
VGVNSFAVPELVQQDKNGYNAEPFKHEEMASLALKILTDKELYAKFSENSLAIAQEHEMSKCVNKMDAMYLKMRDFNTKEKRTTLMNMFLS